MSDAASHARARPLVSPSAFVGLDEEGAYLCCGAEAPLPKAALPAFEAYAREKVRGLDGPPIRDAVVSGVRARLAKRLGLPRPGHRLAFLSSASHALNAVARSLDLREGDEVLMLRDEFPSSPMAFAGLEAAGVGLRVAAGADAPGEDVEGRLISALTARTRVVCVSHVSYLTGRRLDVARIAAACRKAGAVLVVDASHSAGVVALPVERCDALVACGHKFLLGPHGIGLLYWNEQRLGPFSARLPGWNSTDRFEAGDRGFSYRLKDDVLPAEAGNANFGSLYALDAANALAASLPARDIETHALDLAADMRRRLEGLGLALLTPADRLRHAANVAFRHERSLEIGRELGRRRILTWASDGRVRLSFHVFNSARDVERVEKALRDILRP